MKRRAFIGGAAATAATIPAAALAADRSIGTLTVDVDASKVQQMVWRREKSEFARASVNEPVIGWDFEPTDVSPFDVTVIDLDTGEEVLDVIAVNAATGTLERYTTDLVSVSGATEVLKGNFAIVRKT